MTVKTSVRISVYMVEEKGIKIENKNTKKYDDDYDCNGDEKRRARSVFAFSVCCWMWARRTEG